MKNLQIALTEHGDVAEDFQNSIVSSAFNYAKMYEFLHLQLVRKGRAVYVKNFEVVVGDRPCKVLDYYNIKGDSKEPYDRNDPNRLGLNHLFAGQSPHKVFEGSTRPKNGGIQGDSVKLRVGKRTFGIFGRRGVIDADVPEHLIVQQREYVVRKWVSTDAGVSSSAVEKVFEYNTDGTKNIQNVVKSVAENGTVTFTFTLNTYNYAYDFGVDEYMPFVIGTTSFSVSDKPAHDEWVEGKWEPLVIVEAGWDESGSWGEEYLYILSEHAYLRHLVALYGKRIKSQTEEEVVGFTNHVALTSHTYAGADVVGVYRGDFATFRVPMKYWVFTNGYCVSLNRGFYTVSTWEDESGSYTNVDASPAIVRAHILVDTATGRTLTQMIDFIDNWDTMFYLDVEVDTPWWKELLVIVVGTVAGYFLGPAGYGAVLGMIGALGALSGDKVFQVLAIVGSLYSIAQEGLKQSLLKEAMESGLGERAAQQIATEGVQNATLGALTQHALTEATFESFMHLFSAYQTLTAPTPAGINNTEEEEKELGVRVVVGLDDQTHPQLVPLSALENEEEFERWLLRV